MHCNFAIPRPLDLGLGCNHFKLKLFIKFVEPSFGLPVFSSHLQAWLLRTNMADEMKKVKKLLESHPSLKITTIKEEKSRVCILMQYFTNDSCREGFNVFENNLLGIF